MSTPYRQVDDLLDEPVAAARAAMILKSEHAMMPFDDIFFDGFGSFMLLQCGELGGMIDAETLEKWSAKA